MFFLFLSLSIIISKLFFFVLGLRKQGIYTAFRFAFLYTLLYHGLLIYLYNEAFSHFNAITPLTARLFWISIALLNGSIFACFYKHKYNEINLIEVVRSIVILKNVNRPYKVLIYAGFLLLIIPLLWLAIVSPPNNLDSSNYHLNRIVYWIMNRNLDHYPTMHVQQLYHNVFAEYIVMHCFLLQGSDQLVGLVQFEAMVGSVMAVSLLAKQFKLSYRAQLLTAMLLFSLPIGLFESTTTQNDYLACFFFLCFVVLGYSIIHDKSSINVFFFVLALVLGGFTKYTVLFFALPFSVYFGIIFLNRYGIVFCINVFLQVAIFFILVFSPFFNRNYKLFGSVLSPEENSVLFAEKIPTNKFSPAYSLSNVIKNFGLHISLPYNPYNQWVDGKVEQIHEMIGVSLDDQNISINNYHTRFSMQEDMAPNTFHFILLALSLIYLFTHKGYNHFKLLFVLSFIGFFIFCTLLKFQFWSSRTHMPFFAVGSVIITSVYQRISKRISIILPVILGLLSTFVVYGNYSKMIIPVRYMSKKVFGHVPRSICPQGANQYKIYRQVMESYYNFEIASDCFLLNKNYSYLDRRTIFNKLDSINYYNDDKKGGVFPVNRPKAYFANHTIDYKKYYPLMKYVKLDVKNIGVLFKEELGFYHYLASLESYLGRSLNMAYIRYSKEYKILPNSRRQFCYNYILTDNLQLLHQLVPADEILAVYASDPAYYPNQLAIICLKHVSCSKYVY